MIKTSIEKLAKEIGFDIGCSDDIVQSDLLNGFCKGLNNSMNQSQKAAQFCYISNKLDVTTMEVLIELAEYIKLRQEEITKNK